MSCQHGNPLDACDLCDELLAEFRSGIEQGKKDGWEACEACHGIVDGKHTEAESLRQQLAARQTLYHELLMAVESKWPGETRHQTALRYIRQAERSTTTGPAQEFNN